MNECFIIDCISKHHIPNEIKKIIIQYCSKQCTGCTNFFVISKEKCKNCESEYCSAKCHPKEICGSCDCVCCKNCTIDCQRCLKLLCSECICKYAKITQLYFYCSTCHDVTYEENFGNVDTDHVLELEEDEDDYAEYFEMDFD